MKPLLVGECNPYQTDERMAMRYALHPDPPRASGGRLCFVVMGLNEETYLRSFDRVDLCHPKWSLPAARTKAKALLMERGESDVVVVCGAKVASAFGFPSHPFQIYRKLEYRDERMPEIPLGIAPTFVVIPHPSGLNRAWHQPGAVQRARQVLREVGVLPAAEVAHA